MAIVHQKKQKETLEDNVMKYIKFNANLNVKVKLKDKGIEHVVANHNINMPEKFHVSFIEYSSRCDEYGYFNFQLWDFIDKFGDLGMKSHKYYELDIIFDINDFEPFYFKK